MTLTSPPLAARLEIYDPDDVGKALFAAEIAAREVGVLREAQWPTDAVHLDDLGLGVVENLWYFTSGQHRFERVVQVGDSLVFLRLGSGALRASVAADTSDDAAALEAKLRERFTETQPDGRQTVPVTFWALGAHGPISARRRLDVPTWSEVERNYPQELRADMADVMADFKPAHGGQLLLWHGEPGTGKTWALRAMAWEWREWCDVEYVVDPDRFFGSDAAYLTQVLLQNDDSPHDDVGRWRLLVMEDAGELLTLDAHERVGKALSRFLNVVDGMIGQGLRILVLITTNEEIGRLHPAVARPGRAALELHFDPLDASAARDWLADRGMKLGEMRPHTLAELFAIAEQYRERRHPRREVGFRRTA